MKVLQNPVILALVCLLGLGAVVFFGSATEFWAWVCFRYQQPRLDALVSAVKRQRLQPGDRLDFTVALAGTEVLQLDTRQPGMSGSALRTPSGDYVIWIVTRDGGHFGTEGYIYTDGPIKPDIVELTCFPSVRYQLTPHWCTAYNDLL